MRILLIGIQCVAARTFFLVIDSQNKIWSRILCYKNCHLNTCTGLDTILVPFWRYMRNLYNQKILVKDRANSHFNLQEINKKMSTFDILIDKHRVLQLLWCEKSQRHVEGLCMGPSLPNLVKLPFYLMGRRVSATSDLLQANGDVYDWFFFYKC